jgi:FkbM family methyltransferase
MTSLEASPLIPHHSLDFVYIDARHDYDSVMEDLEAWFEKVRPGGVIAGHDYLDAECAAGSFQVKMAVDRFFADRGLAVNCTLFDDPWLTWLVEIPLVETAGEAQQSAGGVAAGTAGVSGNGAGHDAPLAGSDAGAGREVTLRLALAAGDREFRLRLDDSRMSQRMMLECFDRNMLYEAETSHFMATVLRPGDAFIDVGTHVGYFSMLAASIVGPGGTVISFEPELENYQHLLSHVELNGFAHVAPINAAVGATTGRVEFHINGDNDGGHALWEVGLHPFNQRSREKPTTRTVDLVSLDDILRGLEVLPRVIKIDVEGAEHSVLLGARETLQNRPVPFIVAEINRFGLERMGTSEKAVRQYMGEMGYETYAFDPEGGRIIRLGESDSIESDFVFNLVFRHPVAEAA